MGCGGFDTVQQIRISEPLINDLRKNDYFILLTCGNDFGDLLRKSVFGRSKPYIELIDGKIRTTNANSSFIYRLRDISYTIGYSLQFWDALNMKFVFNKKETSMSQNLYTGYVDNFFNRLKSKGVRPFIFFHSLDKTNLVNQLFEKLNSKKINYFNLDKLMLNNSNYFLDDKFHWNAKGNKVVADQMLNYLENDQ